MIKSPSGLRYALVELQWPRESIHHTIVLDTEFDVSPGTQ